MILRKKLLLIDFSNILMRGLSVNQALQSEQGVFTGGLYGFLLMTANLVETHKATHIAICKDVPPYKRIEEFGNYKADRVSQPSKNGEYSLGDLKKMSLPLCAEAVEALGWPVFARKGYEADDMIAYLSDELYDEFDEILIGSNDSDLYQLLDEELKVSCLKKKKNETIKYNFENFVQEYGDITPNKFITMLALAGTHNNVPGIKGIGEKTALKIIKSNRKVDDLNEKHNGIVERNKELIILPFHDLELGEIDLEVPEFNPRKFMNFLTKYDIKITQKMIDAFERLGNS